MPVKTALSIVLPAKNESIGLTLVLPQLKELYPDAEIIVVDDGSTDETAAIASRYGVLVQSHPYSKGNGASIKTGARVATGNIIVFMDGDGQHKPEDIPRLLAEMDAGYDMVVGARTKDSQATVGRGLANRFYNWLSSKLVGHQIQDLTSGFRVVKAKKFKEFIYLLPNGFSYPTTSTMAFFRAGYSVAYVSIKAGQRQGVSHINIARDGLRFLLIIFKVGTLYSPLKLFVPISFTFFITGTGYYLYTYIVSGQFTNMSALLFTTSLLVFLMGLISEQITSLLYSKSNEK